MTDRAPMNEQDATSEGLGLEHRDMALSHASHCIDSTLEERLHRQAMSGDRAAFLRLRGLRRLWRALNTNRKSKTRNQGETHD